MKNNIILYKQVKQQVEILGFNVVNFDFDRPWGGFLVIDEEQGQRFISTFFDQAKISFNQARAIYNAIKLTPKIIIVNPKSRLSWQYHYRRKEIWKVFKNEVGVIRSIDNNESEMKIFNVGDVIELKQGERHRLIGLSDFGIVAEIWIHTDPANPSDENDIVRLQDDYARD